MNAIVWMSEYPECSSCSGWHGSSRPSVRYRTGASLPENVYLYHLHLNPDGDLLELGTLPLIRLY